MRRIYANHLQGIGGSTLRKTLWEMFQKDDKSSNKTDTKTINNWLKENTYFKTYKLNEPSQTEKNLIKKYNPILNKK